MKRKSTVICGESDENESDEETCRNMKVIETGLGLGSTENLTGAVRQHSK